MNDLARKIARASRHVEPEWTASRAPAVERRMLIRRARRRLAAILLPAALALTLGIAAWKHPAPTPRAALELPGDSAPPLDGVIHFDDGSVAAPLSPSSVVRAAEVRPTAVLINVERGAAHFEVTPNPARVFRVVSAGVLVEVIGTGFVVERRDTTVHVAVEHGRVRVHWSNGDTELGSGEARDIPIVAAPPTAIALAPAEDAGAATSPTAPSASPTPPAPSAAARPRGAWRSLAGSGDFDRAYAALKAEGAAGVRDEPAELLLASDVARLSHHAAEAVAPLQRVIDSFPGDPRAPLAAFTLGRVLLDELGRPADAARVFARTRSLASSGPLAEDALAREVESLWRAGETSLARGRAEEYVARYPGGVKLRSVRKYGGLE